MPDSTDRVRGALTLHAPAKVNLFLEVLARRPDGYHAIESLLVAVSLFDTLEFMPGAALTLIIPYIAPGREGVSKTGLLIIALCLAVIVYCFAQAYQRMKIVSVDAMYSTCSIYGTYRTHRTYRSYYMILRRFWRN